ncbi:MAG: hypothetical protein GY786_01795 [Proteobacteria bacterium]|nr:hypothetical protein [Pseudomonadota bacterium]
MNYGSRYGKYGFGLKKSSTLTDGPKANGNTTKKCLIKWKVNLTKRKSVSGRQFGDRPGLKKNIHMKSSPRSGAWSNGISTSKRLSGETT